MSATVDGPVLCAQGRFNGSRIFDIAGEARDLRDEDDDLELLTHVVGGSDALDERLGYEVLDMPVRSCA